MPPRRRTGQSATTRQSTLSFGSKSRVTKPSSTSVSAKKIKDVDYIDEAVSKASLDTSVDAQALVAPPSGLSQPHIAEVVVREQAKSEIEKPLTEEDRRALKITDADLKKYWKAEEEKRKAPRVHQEDLDINEKILRHFDLSSQYGPCIGISRLKRWRRAHMLNLNPPLEVLAVLLKDQTVKQRAYVDELMS
ncbi:hypothetical protein VTN77DRAFT_308 [Rasamsonia byssochlamydoides]|uniref:uncharacterized protein n=1 Tax=Rasamsonia byssochlamydoides TaxID=89139 RepID=UPI0037421F64